VTALGAAILLAVTVLVGGWILDLVRRGRLYVGYGIVLLALMGVAVSISVLPSIRSLAARLMGSLYPSEPVAVLGLATVLLLVIYILHQLSVLSDRVARLTQELAIRNAAPRAGVSSPAEPPSAEARTAEPGDPQAKA